MNVKVPVSDLTLSTLTPHNKIKSVQFKLSLSPGGTNPTPFTIIDIGGWIRMISTSLVQLFGPLACPAELNETFDPRGSELHRLILIVRAFLVTASSWSRSR